MTLRYFEPESVVACDVTHLSDAGFSRGSTNAEPGAVATGSNTHLLSALRHLLVCAEYVLSP